MHLEQASADTTKIEASTTIDCPLEQVWEFIKDVGNFPKWNPRILEMKQTSVPLGLGTTIRSTHPRQLVLDEQIVEYVPNARMTLESMSGPIKGSRVTFSMKAVGGKTKLTRLTSLKLSGIYKFAGPIASFRAKRDIVVEILNIKRILEAPAKES